MKKYLIEFIGTFFLVLVVALTGNPLAIGGFLIAMVYAGGYISGAHYNPAVTFTLLLSKKIKSDEAVRYMIIQMIAGVCAAAMYYLLKGVLFIPQPAVGVSLITALIVEIVFTFLLTHTILRVAASNEVKNNQYFGLAIGLALMVGAFAGGPISGGAYNPAVGVGPLLFDLSHFGQHLPSAILYIVGPCIGGALASIVYGWE